jgi:hypothetical protein
MNMLQVQIWSKNILNLVVGSVIVLAPFKTLGMFKCFLVSLGLVREILVYR